MDYLRPISYGIVVFIGAVFICFPLSRWLIGDDRLSGVLMVAGFGIFWLFNLVLNVKDYGRVGPIRRNERPMLYYLAIALLALAGIGLLCCAVLLALQPLPPRP